MKTRLPALARGRLAIPLAATLVMLPALAVRGAAQSSPEPVALGDFIITATRTPVRLSALGSSVDLISGDDLARQQVSSLQEALGGAAGMPLFASGATGAAASLFMRGANSNQTLFLVDGMRMNDPNTDYSVFLGGAAASPSDTVEIARGPQSTLYGGEAIGGVVAMRTLKGEGAPSAQLGVEGGSFGTIQSSVNTQGTGNGWAYNAFIDSGRTENQRPNNDFSGTTYAVRLDRQLSPQITVGATARGFFGTYGSPGDRFTNDPDNREREQNQLATLFAEYTVSPLWSGHITLGGQDRRFVSVNPTPGEPTETTEVLNRRGEFDWQNTIVLSDSNRLTAGLTAERDQTRNDGFGDIHHQENSLAFFAEDEWTPATDVFLTAGLRSEDHDTFGRTTTGRLTAAWLPGSDRIKFRASYGTGFRSPSFLDLYGQSSYYVGNPDLQPERARGWDVGVDYYLAQHHGTLSATWFDTRTHDLIVYDFSVFPGTTANVDQARSRGLELSAKAQWVGAWESRVAYTYLEADNLTEHTRLLRRPRHSVSADVWRNLGRGFSVGAGVQFVAQRQDVDALTFATVDAPDYTVVRAYAAWVVTEHVTVKVHVENFLNEHYEEVNGYPALGARVFAGVVVRF
jgi:vitamin B12 transporter